MAEKRKRGDRRPDETRRQYQARKRKERYEAIKADPERYAVWLAKKVAQNKRRLDERRSTPEGFAALQERGRGHTWRPRMMATEEGRKLIAESRRKWRRSHPDLWNAQRRRNRARFTIKRRAWVKLSQADTLKALRKLIPGYLPPHARDDVFSDLALAMLEGRCLPEMVKATIRKAATRYSPTFQREVSLDAPVPGMEGMTFLDLLADQKELADA